MKRKFTTVIGIFGVLIGLGFILPALAQLRTSGSLPGLSVALLLLGTALSIGGVSTALCCFRKRRVASINGTTTQSLPLAR